MSVYTCSCNSVLYRSSLSFTRQRNLHPKLPMDFTLIFTNVEYLPIADIVFTSASTKKQNLDTAVDNLDEISVLQKQVGVKSKILPSYKEMECFYECLGKSNSVPMSMECEWCSRINTMSLSGALTQLNCFNLYSIMTLCIPNLLIQTDC